MASLPNLGERSGEVGANVQAFEDSGMPSADRHASNATLNQELDVHDETYREHYTGFARSLGKPNAQTTVQNVFAQIRTWWPMAAAALFLDGDGDERVAYIESRIRDEQVVGEGLKTRFTRYCDSYWASCFGDGNDSDAKTAEQEAFHTVVVRVLSSWPKKIADILVQENEVHLRCYVARSVKNEICNEHRKRIRRSEISVGDLSESVASEDAQYPFDDVKALIRCVESLEPDERTRIHDRFLRSMTWTQMAEKHNSSKDTIRRRTNEIMAKLRNMLQSR